MSLSSSIVSNENYPLLKLAVLEKAFLEIPHSERSDGIKCGIHKAFMMLESLALQAKMESGSTALDFDPDLHLAPKEQ